MNFITNIFDRACLTTVYLYGEFGIIQELRNNVSTRVNRNTSWYEDLKIERRDPYEILYETNPVIRRAMQKLQQHPIPYQKMRWRAAMNVQEWLWKNYIQTGILTKVELESVPVAFFRKYNYQLYQALSDQRRSQ